MRMNAMRRVALGIVVAGALAALVATGVRLLAEHRSRFVEISMDQQDLADFTSAYGYDVNGLLRLMKASGLTSLAVYEELGNRINLGTHAFVQTGQQIIDDARTAPLADPLLASLVRSGALDANSVYILVYDQQTLDRYLLVLRNQLESRNVRLLRAVVPALLQVRTQIDYFNNLGLGMPQESIDQAHALGLFIDPRVENNERLDADHIDVVFRQMLSGDSNGTVIFFGLRNEVLGYPYNLDATADAFLRRQQGSSGRIGYHPPLGPRFGNVEAYDPTQFQKGGDALGRKIPSLTVRVQAISRLELDKLDLDTVVSRYILGVRERNIRVVYVRPFPHLAQERQRDGTYRTLTAQETNLEMLRRIRDGLVANGFYLGRPSTFPDFDGIWMAVLFFIASLGATASFLLLLELYGWSRPWMHWTAYAITLVAFWGSYAIGHDDIARRLWALGAALTFAVLAGTTLAPYFKEPAAPAATFAGDARAGARCLFVAVGVSLLGALFVVGLLAQATFMLEVQQFFGVKALLIAPPIIVLLLYLLTPMFGHAARVADAGAAPVKAWQLAAIFALLAGAVLLVMRSGNQPDVDVSSFETHLRGSLTALLGARPRFKEFLVAFPLLLLLPALVPRHRRALGWLIVIAAGLGVADVIDTFSHIHTPLIVSVLRLFNALVVGGLIGLVLQALYRRVRAALPAAA
jgi:hypothetical protein